MTGLTLDTGAVVHLERNRGETATKNLITVAQRNGMTVTVPVLVIGEWWRGQRGVSAHLLASFHIEPLTEQTARIAGEALAKVPTSLPKGKGPSLTDAIVMASAAQRGDLVLTSDHDDLDMLRELAFPAVKLRTV